MMGYFKACEIIQSTIYQYLLTCVHNIALTTPPKTHSIWHYLTKSDQYLSRASPYVTHQNLRIVSDQMEHPSAELLNSRRSSAWSICCSSSFFFRSPKNRDFWTYWWPCDIQLVSLEGPYLFLSDFMIGIKFFWELTRHDKLSNN